MSLLYSAVNSSSVSPTRSWWIDATGFPALLLLWMKLISLSGCCNRRRISSPPVYPAPPIMPALIFFPCFMPLCFVFNRILHHVIDERLITEDLAESSHVFSGPTSIHLSIFSKFAAHEIVTRYHTCYNESVRMKFYEYIAGHISLRRFEVSFNIAHHRIENLSFVQPVAI